MHRLYRAIQLLCRQLLEPSSSSSSSEKVREHILNEMQVYECEYQQYIFEYLNNCPLSETPGIPYFPAPDDAPDSCSCNLGKLFEAVNGTIFEYSTCENNVSAATLSSLANGDATSNAEDAAVCACCAQSAALSE